MKEFLTDLLTKVNDSLDIKIKNNSPLIINNFFKSIYVPATSSSYAQYNLSASGSGGMLLIPIYRDSQATNNHLPSWCEKVNNGFVASITATIPNVTNPVTFATSIEKTFRIKKSGFYLIEYEMPKFSSFTFSSGNAATVIVGQYHLNPDGAKQTPSGMCGLFTGQTEYLQNFLDSRKRDVFYFEEGSLLGGLFFIITDDAPSNKSIVLNTGNPFWNNDYSYAKITPVNYYR